MAQGTQAHSYRERRKRHVNDQALEIGDELLNMLANCAENIESHDSDLNNRANHEKIAGSGRVRHAPPQQLLAGTQARPGSNHGRQPAGKEEASGKENTIKHDTRMRGARINAGSRNWAASYLQLVKLPSVADAVAQLDTGKSTRALPVSSGLLNQMLGAIMTAAANPSTAKFPDSELPSTELFTSLMRSTAAITIPFAHGTEQAAVSLENGVHEIVPAAVARFPVGSLTAMHPLTSLMQSAAAAAAAANKTSLAHQNQVADDLNAEIEEVGPTVAVPVANGRQVRPRTRYTDADRAEPYQTGLE